MSRKVILYIATSIDGYIAKTDGDIAFLDKAEDGNEDYGYYKFIDTVDTIIWGRKTYDKVLSFDVEFPHKDKKVYVLSSTRTGKEEYIEYANDIDVLIAKLRTEPGKNIYCDGGGGVVAQMLKSDLIDEVIITVIPHLLGDGIRLFYPNLPEHEMELVRSQSYKSGVVQMHYRRVRK